jgi:hypothetical protein
MGSQRNGIEKLMIFARKILRKIFGPTKELNGLLRINLLATESGI